MSVGIAIDNDTPRVYVPAADGSVVVMVSIKDTPETREAAVQLAAFLAEGLDEARPQLVVIDYRSATITALDFAQIDQARAGESA